jgi:hypothetical protein
LDIDIVVKAYSRALVLAWFSNELTEDDKKLMESAMSELRDSGRVNVRVDERVMLDREEAEGLGCIVDIQTIACEIGHHFWHCKSDGEAINCGMECAKKIMKKLEE